MSEPLPTPAPVPALVVAGFLGAGKTTLVDRLLRAAQAEGVRLAIVSNEFGDTGIDRALLDSGEEGFVELDGGCVCCRLSDVLSETLATLITRVRPDRVVLECSGVALPGEIVVQFWRPPLSELVSDETVVVVVDAERAAAEGQPDPTFLDQLAAADVVVVNKRDLVDGGALARARERIDRWTGGQPQLVASHAEIDLAVLFPPGTRPRRTSDPRPHDHDHDRFGTKEIRFADGTPETEVLDRVKALGALRAKGFVRTDRGLRVVQGVGPRITTSPPARPVPDELVGTVVVIHREDD